MVADTQMCIQPCTVVLENLDKRDVKLEKEMYTWQDNINKNLTGINACMQSKIPSKLFWKAVGFGGFFVFIFIGGMMWSLKDTVSNMDTSVQVMSVTVKSTERILNNEIRRSEIEWREHKDKASDAYQALENRVDKIERGETYFNFHNKSQDKFNFDPKNK